MKVFRALFLTAVTALIFCAPLFAFENTRQIRIKAVVSPSFKSNPDWEKDIRERISFANQVFEHAYGLFFVFEGFIDWTPQDEKRSMDLLIEELRSLVTLNPGEIIVGFHRMTQEFSKDVLMDSDTVGSAQFFRGYAIIRDPFRGFDLLQRQIVLTHEIGHLFGAVHADQTNLIMSPQVALKPSLVLDDDNQAIIQATRNLDFQQGIDSLSNETLDLMIEIYEKRIRQNPMSDFYFHLGNFYEKRNLPAKAVAIWEEAIRYHYDDPYIHHALGFYYFRNARYDMAIQELNSAYSHFILPSQRQQRVDTLNALGAAYFQKGNPDEAIYHWLQGLSVDSDNVILQSNLAAAYLETGNLDKGITELEKIVAKGHADATVLSNLGIAYSRAKKFEEAIKRFDEALYRQSLGEKGSPSAGTLFRPVTEAEIRLNLGAAYIGLRQSAKALIELEKSRALDSRNFNVHRNLAQAYILLGQYENAVKETEEALRYKKDDPALYSFLAQSYSETNRTAEAIQAAKDGLRYAEGEIAASFHRNLAILYDRERQYDEAIAELKLALNLNWKDADAHTHLGVIYANRGNMSDARRSLENALRINPEHEQAKKILNSLPKN